MHRAAHAGCRLAGSAEMHKLRSAGLVACGRWEWGGSIAGQRLPIDAPQLLGFPVFYVTDVLQIAEALVALGYGADLRLAHLREAICAKADLSGCWLLEYDYSGKTWGDFGVRGRPNPWVTLRALRVLDAAAPPYAQ